MIVDPDPKSTTYGLYSKTAERKYLNLQEHARFVAAAKHKPAEIQRFALVLAYTGVRLSEARQLTYGAIQPHARVVSVRTLKRHGKLVVREIPLPHLLLEAFTSPDKNDSDYIWAQNGQPVPRIKAYRWIKQIMNEAGIDGVKACPRGLRHAYGIRAILSGVPLHMLQQWMGHASMETTAIYATVLGKEQLALSDQMWGE